MRAAGSTLPVSRLRKPRAIPPPGRTPGPRTPRRGPLAPDRAPPGGAAGPEEVAGAAPAASVPGGSAAAQTRRSRRPLGRSRLPLKPRGARTIGARTGEGWGGPTVQRCPPPPARGPGVLPRSGALPWPRGAGGPASPPPPRAPAAAAAARPSPSRGRAPRPRAPRSALGGEGRRSPANRPSRSARHRWSTTSMSFWMRSCREHIPMEPPPGDQPRAPRPAAPAPASGTLGARCHLRPRRGLEARRPRRRSRRGRGPGAGAGGGAARPDVAAQLPPPDARTPAWSLPPPPGAGPRGPGCWRRPESEQRRGAGEGRTRSASRAHAPPPRGPPGRRGRCSAARRRPSRARRAVTRSPAAVCPSVRPRARAGLSAGVGSEGAVGLPAPPFRPHFYECHSTFRRNYESDGKPKSEWPGEGVGGIKEKSFPMGNK